MKLKGKVILITGGTGSLGKALTERILAGDMGEPEKIIIFSRDEAKQFNMNQEITDNRISFMIGDVRRYDSILRALKLSDVVIHTAAMKHVTSCQQNPFEAVLTNVLGTQNIIRAVRDESTLVTDVVGVASDKGCNPVNVYGATKFLQEKMILAANDECPDTRFFSVCYGNVMASRGSVIPIFQRQIENGGPVTITDPRMTRFLLSLNQAVDIIFTALATATGGEVFIPEIPAATIGDIADVLIGDKPIEKKVIGIKPGEKMHEILIAGEEISHTVWVGNPIGFNGPGGYYVVSPAIQECPALKGEYISSDHLLDRESLELLFKVHGIIERNKE